MVVRGALLRDLDLRYDSSQEGTVRVAPSSQDIENSWQGENTSVISLPSSGEDCGEAVEHYESLGPALFNALVISRYYLYARLNRG